MNNKGYIATLVAAIVLILIVGGGIAWFHYHYLPNMAKQGVASSAVATTSTTTAAQSSTTANSTSITDIQASSTPARNKAPSTNAITDTKTNNNNKTQTVSAYQGATITLDDGSSITIPPGLLKQNETVTVTLVNKLADSINNKGLSQVGDGLMLQFSPAAEFNGTHILSSATSTSGIKFVIYTGDNTAGVAGGFPMSWIIDTIGHDYGFGAAGLEPFYSSSTYKITAYVTPDYLGIVSSTKEVDVGMINFSF